MIPFKDDNPIKTFPFITIGIIALNIIVFIWELTSPIGEKTIVASYGALPSSILSMQGNQPVSPALTVFSSMFMHGGILHIAGNMLYLWIFGNNIEDKLGHFRFIAFYLLGGIVAAYSHAITNPSSNIPMIGASGAIAGVLGAYIVLFPHARVHTLIFFGFFIDIVRIPALIVISFWAIIQFISGALSQGLAAHAGVAWFAHIGGFLFGLLTIKLWLFNRRSLE
ncbi:MAG: rhomboid family intramembrane serine protease [Nitrospiraceae bacterium]|nr:rhomboid family intramembrane serine protease [Nitrospiraceae bacterium]